MAESYDGVRESCSRYLDQFNFQVVQAAHGEQVLAHVAAEPPHVILTELNLPAMPALRLTQWLAQNWRTRKVPVIVLAEEGESVEALEFRNHVAGVLVKPFSLVTMLDEVRRVLRAGVPGESRQARL